MFEKNITEKSSEMGMVLLNGNLRLSGFFMESFNFHLSVAYISVLHSYLSGKKVTLFSRKYYEAQF